MRLSTLICLALFVGLLPATSGAEEHLPAGTRIERPGLPVLVVGTGGMAAWIFSRSDVEAVVEDRDALDACRVDLRRCQAEQAHAQAATVERHAVVPWAIAIGVAGCFAGGVYVGVHAR